MNEQCGSNQKDLDVFSDVNDAYNLFHRRKYFKKQFYFKHIFMKMLNSKISLFLIGYKMSLEKKII